MRRAAEGKERRSGGKPSGTERLLEEDVQPADEAGDAADGQDHPHRLAMDGLRQAHLDVLDLQARIGKLLAQVGVHRLHVLAQVRLDFFHFQPNGFDVLAQVRLDLLDLEARGLDLALQAQLTLAQVRVRGHVAQVGVARFQRFERFGDELGAALVFARVEQFFVEFERCAHGRIQKGKSRSGF